jgi:hypothetical protein
VLVFLYYDAGYRVPDFIDITLVVNLC